MKFESNIFYQLARAIGLSSPDASGTTIEIPAALNGMIVPVNPLDIIGISATGAIQQSSFTNAVFADVNAGVGGADVLVATFGPGLWEFSVFGGSNSNYANAGLFLDQYVYFVALGAGNQLCLNGFNAAGAAAAPQAQTLFTTFRVLLPAASYQLRMSSANNAAGQRMTSSFSIVAMKLL